MRRDLSLAPRVFTPADVRDNAAAMARIFADHGVEAAVLFGSLAEPVAEGGDLDLAVSLGPGGQIQPVYEAFCRLFAADNVDVVALEALPFSVRKRALLGGRVVFERTVGHVSRLVEDLLREAPDHAYTSAAVERLLRERLKEGLSMAERRLDRERISACLSRLDVSVRRLKGLRERAGSFDAFAADEDLRDLGAHHLRLAIECVLDVCRHYLAVKGVSLQELDTTNLIELAGRRGLMPGDFAQRIRGMAGMRNVLVHGYLGVDYRAVWDLMTARLADFDEFGRHALRVLEQE